MKKSNVEFLIELSEKEESYIAKFPLWVVGKSRGVTPAPIGWVHGYSLGRSAVTGKVYRLTPEPIKMAEQKAGEIR